MTRLRRALRLLRFRGIGYPLRVILRVLVPRLAWSVASRLDAGRGRRRTLLLILLAGAGALVFLAPILGLRVGAAGGVAAAGVAAAFAFGRPAMDRRAAMRLVRGASTPVGGTIATPWAEPEVRGRVEQYRAEEPDGEVCLGSFDNDGRFLSRYGTIPGLSPISEAEFVPRYRFDLDLVLLRDEVVVRKHFRGDRSAFRREWLALTAIPSQARAPQCRGAYEEGLVLHKSFVPGETLRDALVRAGARILTVDVETEDGMQSAGRLESIEEVWRRGRERLKSVLGAEGLSALETQLDVLHGAGVTGFSLTFGNVVLDQATGEPWFVDFDAAVVHRSTSSVAFRLARDRDRRLFERIYGRSVMTEARAREVLASFSGGYAPIDLGGGLVTRGFWSVDSGMGRWEVVNAPALGDIFAGKDVLDLGTNNGVMAMMMLRAGARRVIGVERDEGAIAAATQVRALFEWRDMRRYDLELVHDDMLTAVEGFEGKVDIVTAFCSLYYLDDEAMAKVVSRAAEIAPVLILQANDSTRASAADGKARKSSSSMLRSLAEQNGYRNVRVAKRMGHPRVLLVCEAA